MRARYGKARRRGTRRGGGAVCVACGPHSPSQATRPTSPSGAALAPRPCATRQRNAVQSTPCGYREYPAHAHDLQHTRSSGADCEAGCSVRDRSGTAAVQDCTGRMGDVRRHICSGLGPPLPRALGWAGVGWAGLAPVARQHCRSMLCAACGTAHAGAAPPAHRRIGHSSTCRGATTCGSRRARRCPPASRARGS